MKKTIFIFLILISLLSTVALVQGESTTYNIQITFSSNPIIVAPGTYDYIEVNFNNIGSETIHIWDINAKSLDSSAVQSKGNWNVELGDLDGGESTTVLYEFFVPSTTTAGFYQVVFDVSCSGHDSKQTAMIKVEDSTVLDITSVKPSSIKIGEITTLVFNITNNGGASASNILFVWEDSSDLILPVGSDNRITVSSIAANNYSEITNKSDQVCVNRRKWCPSHFKTDNPANKKDYIKNNNNYIHKKNLADRYYLYLNLPKKLKIKK